MAIKKRKNTVHLACTECGRRNHTVTKSNQTTERLSLKKHCVHCQKHTLHLETK